MAHFPTLNPELPRHPSMLKRKPRNLTKHNMFDDSQIYNSRERMFRSSSANGDNARSSVDQKTTSGLNRRALMSQTFTKLPGGRVYKLDQVLNRIKESQNK